MEVKELIEKLSVREVARAIDVAEFTVTRWKQGKTKPSPLAQKELDKLAKKRGLE